MFDIHRVELDWGGRKLVLETGKIARQADGAVVATYGESKLLATVVAAKEPKAGIDFLPLTCNYLEKFYAAGRIPGGYFKREGRPTERETLISRLIDRPIRPLFADGWRCDTQVIVHRALARSRERSRHPGDGRGLRRADALGRSLHGSDRRRARRLHQQRIRAQSAARRDAGEPARPRRRRHAGRRADGRVGSQGADRRDHARRRDVRPPPLPAGDRRHHQARRKGRQGAARAAACPTTPLSKRRCSAWSRRTCARPMRSRDKMARHKAVDAAKAKVDGAFPAGGRGEPDLSQAAGRHASSRSSKPRSCAGTSSTPASASTAAT